MDKNKKIVDYALLSWTRLKMKIDSKNKKSEVKKNIEELNELEEYLKTCNIKDIEIIYKSQDYYTLRYLKEGQACIKQFTTEEVESSI